jgi:uncharacterized membrane protein YhhN
MPASVHPAKSFSLLYGAILLLELLCEQMQPEARYFLYFIKPLALLSLGAYVVVQIRKGKASFSWWLLAAIFFSWLGDIFLMFQAEIWFMLGLGSFLLAQLAYAWLFRQEGGGFLRKKPVWALPFLAFGLGLMGWLWPHLGDLKVPVALYASAILLMNLMALSRKEKVSETSFRWVMVGAILFLISDSLIALNKFYQPITGARLLIMLTYLSAQFLLVMGWLKGKE